MKSLHNCISNILSALNELNELNELSDRPPDTPLINLPLYNVSFHTSDYTELIYNGIDKSRAIDEYDLFDDIPDKLKHRVDMYVELSTAINTYELVYELDTDYETVDDYPIDEYYDDPEIYKSVDNGEYEVVERRDISPANVQSDKLLNDVDKYFHSKYGTYKYNTIDVYDGDDLYTGNILLRISDHTENIHNIDRHISHDYYISVVISDFDATEGRFGMSNAMERRRNEIELKFTSNDALDDVIHTIEFTIEKYESLLIDSQS